MADDIVARIGALLITCEASPCDCRCLELREAAQEIGRLRKLAARLALAFGAVTPLDVDGTRVVVEAIAEWAKGIDRG